MRYNLKTTQLIQAVISAKMAHEIIDLSTVGVLTRLACLVTQIQSSPAISVSYMCVGFTVGLQYATVYVAVHMHA